MSEHEREKGIAKDRETDIDQVLAGLRNVAPPAGMNHRLLHAMKTAPPRSPWGWLTSRTLVPATIALAVVVAIPYFHPTAPTRSAAVNPSSRTSTNAGAPRLDSQTWVAAAAPQRHKLPSTAHRVEQTDPETALALAELHAPSHPAPPLPLTSQENLLLNIARQGAPVELTQLAVLDPDLRAEQETAREAALRHALFPSDDPPDDRP